MSLRSPPGAGRAWPQLLAFVLDDDDRTRRAGVLLRQLATVLLAIGILAIAVILLAHHLSGWYAGAGVGSVIGVILRRKRTRA